MAQYYTPFMTQAGAAIGQALADKGQRAREAEINKLAGSAYMGDPEAMKNLMQVNPALGAQIQANVQKKQETAQQAKLAQMSELRKEHEDIAKNIAAFPDFESSKEYGQKQMEYLKQRYPDVVGQLDDDTYDEEDFKEAKMLAGGGGAFSGTSMDAQVSNMLSKGVEDPEFRDTPEYARAWQLANEPKIIRTPTGDIPLRPELSHVFKPPGEVKSNSEQVAEIKKQVKKDVEIIPGTEREEKTTADEKVSAGYYNRMLAAEENISKLGDFNSADMWERFKGITNVTASPELQQYRQAADDWIRAKLRRESGAVIGDEEMSKEYQIYFPQIGDSQAVISQKASARKQAEKSMQIAAGKEMKKQSTEEMITLPNGVKVRKVQ